MPKDLIVEGRIRQIHLISRCNLTAFLGMGSMGETTYSPLGKSTYYSSTPQVRGRWWRASKQSFMGSMILKRSSTSRSKMNPVSEEMMAPWKSIMMARLKSGRINSFWLSPLSSTLEPPELLIYPYYIVVLISIFCCCIIQVKKVGFSIFWRISCPGC